MGKGLETGNAFLKGVLSKITDPEQRATAEKLFANPVIATEIGNGVEGQSEIDRRMQELTAQANDLKVKLADLDTRDAGLAEWHQNLTAWRTANEELVRLGKAAKAGTTVVTPPAAAAAATPPGLTAEQFDERLSAERGNFLGFQRDQNQLMRKHFSTFGEVLDLEPLLVHPKVRDLGLLGVYDLVHHDALAKKAEDSKKAEEERIRADERQKVLSSTTTMPYPTPTGSNAGSPLDALKPIDNPGGPLVDAAVAEFNRLQAQRASAN